MIVWRDDLNIGVPAVDAQHQQMVLIMNDFLQACAEQRGKSKIMETLDFLLHYTATHFGDEEQVMRDHHYPDYDNHKQEHERFLQDVMILRQQVETHGATTLTTVKINRTLVDWVINHIQKNDQLIGNFMKASHE
jgi:hemerythrin